MRGQENPQTSMFSYVSLEQRVPKDHPLRTLRALVDGILANMSALFDERYSHTGRPSISPEQLLHALLVQILFTIRSERLLDTDIACPFFRRVLHLAQWQGFVSDEHFSVDGTMIEAWASHMTHALSENRNGFVADVESTQTSGRAELETAIRMVDRSVRKPGATIGADKGYDTAEFVGELERRGIRAHVARKVTGSAVDGRTARGKGYAMSLRRRKMIEEAFGWIKTVGGLRKTRHKGLEKLSGQALFAFAACMQPDQTAESDAAGGDRVRKRASAAWRAAECRGERTPNHTPRRSSGAGKNERKGMIRKDSRVSHPRSHSRTVLRGARRRSCISWTATVGCVPPHMNTSTAA
jgi:transposase